jgi:hypothetical protein
MSGFSRSRWAALGAAVAVTLGAGGMGIVGATTSSSSKAVYVPIEPCRLADTRPGPENIGTRSTPIGANGTHTFTVHGTNGKCSVPAGATAIVANVTAVAPTAQSFMTIWPAGKDQPTASSLNYSAGQAPFPNAVTVTLSTDGKLDVFNKNGSVHVLIDIAGYFQDHNHDDRYYTKSQTDKQLAAIPAGPKGDTGAKGVKGDRGASAWDIIPSGVTVTGVWGQPTNFEAGAYPNFSIALPGRAAIPLTQETVNFAPNDSGVTIDDDPTCTGTGQAPTAPPGKVCLYLDYGGAAYPSLGLGNISQLGGYYNGGLDDSGFYVAWQQQTAGFVQIYLSWAYTAP